jgi:hypothetical protein
MGCGAYHNTSGAEMYDASGHLLLADGCVLRRAQRADERHQGVLPELRVALRGRRALSEPGQQRSKVGPAVGKLLLRRRQCIFHLLSMALTCFGISTQDIIIAGLKSAPKC